MPAPTVVVGIDLGISDVGDFVVGTSLVGGADLIGDGLTTVSNTVNRVSIRRGRTGTLVDPIDAGTVVIQLNNENRAFDPAHASGPYFGKLVPSRGVSVMAGGVTIFTGFVEDWDLEYDVSGRSVALTRCTDALGILGQTEFDAWTNVGATGATKLSNICDRPEVDWPSGLRAFDDTVNANPGPVGALQSDSVSWGSNVLNYMQQIAKSEFFSLLYATAAGVLRYRQYAGFGLIFFPGERFPGFKFGFSDSFAPIYPAVSASLSDAGGSFQMVITDVNGDPITDEFGTPITASVSRVAYESIARTLGSETLFSSASVDRTGGTAQTATVAALSTWQATYGRLRRLSVPDTLLAADSYALKMAQALRDYYDTPADVVTSITVQVAALSVLDQTTVLSVDIGDAISVTFTPNGVGVAITRTLAVQGISHIIEPESHLVTFSLFDYLGAI